MFFLELKKEKHVSAFKVVCISLLLEINGSVTLSSDSSNRGVLLLMR